MKFQFEVTDTYGGEANYAWVRRTVVELPDGTSDKLLGMLAREWAGYTGKACRVENYGDAMTIRPAGMAQVLFVTDLIGGEPEVTTEQVLAWADSTLAALETEAASLVRPMEAELAKAIAKTRTLVNLRAFVQGKPQNEFCDGP